jgi:hypothetical protein
MGFIAKIFGKEKSQPYVDAGTALVFELSRSLNLTDWNEGLPNYSPEELEIIQKRLSQFQKIANSELGGEAKFHPDALPELQRMLAGEALTEFAGEQWKFSDDVPANWKNLVSIYLKAWVSRLDPQTFLDLGDLLVKASHQNEAKKVFQTVLLFPTYAKKMWGKDNDELLDLIVGRAKESLQDLGS